MKKIVLAFLLGLISITGAHTASLYILYDPSCMDRLEYVALNGNDKGEYIVYHVNTSPGVKVVLEVGPESRTSQDFPPAQVINCNNAVFDKKLVNVINSNIETVFMVVKKGKNRYFISPITLAARYLRAEDFIFYDSPKYRFRFDIKQGTIGENIAFENPKTEVYFEAVIENDCSGKLLFTQKAEFAGNPHTNIELIPEIGIVEERSGINEKDAMQNVLRLEAVNGKKLQPYLRQICQGIEEPIPDESNSIADAGQPTGGVLTPRPGVETIIPPTVETLPPPTTAAARPHKVKKGETLYRISKQYNVSVDQLRAWNNKGNSNTIYVGEDLQVAPSTQARTSPKEGAIQTLAGPLGYDNTGPAPAQSTRILPGKGPAPDNFHIVQPGQTVASIAMRYGYTEQRFREFNNLGRNEVAKAGQALKTSDCDCPQPYVAPAIVNNQNPGNLGYPLQEYANPQGRIGNTTPPGTPPATNPSENFYEDDLRSNYLKEEYNYLNTPLFLDRPSAPPSLQEPVPVRPEQQRPTAPARAPVQTRQPSPQGDFYTVTAERTGITNNTGNSNPSGQGIISRSLSNRSQTAAAGIQEYGYEGPAQRYEANGSTARSARSFHLVKDGDTLYSIARRYEVTVEKLRAINNLGAREIIIPYQKIYLN